MNVVLFFFFDFFSLSSSLELSEEGKEVYDKGGIKSYFLIVFLHMYVKWPPSPHFVQVAPTECEPENLDNALDASIACFFLCKTINSSDFLLIKFEHTTGPGPVKIGADFISLGKLLDGCASNPIDCY